MKSKNKILCVAAHCDDIEFSCAASIAKFLEEGHDVYVAIFSFCNLPNSDIGSKLKVESADALNYLKVKTANIFSYSIDVRRFNEYRQEILEELVKLNKNVNPDLVVIPNSLDIHQDHHVIYEESIRAFKRTSIIGYEMPWNNLRSINNFHVKLEERHLEAQVGAVKQYKSQIFRGYSDRDLFFGLARVRGAQIGVEYAQSFELIRWIE